MNQASQILAEVKKAVCGKDRVLIWVLTVILAKGHILLEDIPGVGKTTVVGEIVRRARKAGRRQDDHGAGVFPRTGAGLRARTVYAGCAAERYHGLQHF